MFSVELLYINHLLIDLKGGKSLIVSEEGFKSEFPVKAKQLTLKQNKGVLTSTVLYELELTLSRGRQGYPVLKSLLKLREKAISRFVNELDKFINKAPFYALIPLFLFYFPALILVFVGPFLSSFINGVN